MKKGFTLIEMTVVVCILSIILLLTVPNIQKVIRIVDDKGCKALEKVVDSAILEYKLAYDVYPDDIDDLINAGLLDDSQSKCSNGKSVMIYDGKAMAQ